MNSIPHRKVFCLFSSFSLSLVESQRFAPLLLLLLLESDRLSPFHHSIHRESVSRVGLSENTPQLEFVVSGEFWKWQAEAVRARREAEKLCGKERKLWAEFLKRFGVILRGLIGLQFLDRRRFQLQRSSKAREFDSTRASTARKRHERAIA